jgi:hypothetical protein
MIVGRKEQKESDAVEFIQPNCPGINEIWSKVTKGLTVIGGGGGGAKFGGTNK